MLNVSGCLQVADDSWIMSENYLFARLPPEFSGPTNVVIARHWDAF